MTTFKALLRKVRRKISFRQRIVVDLGDGRLLAKTKDGTRMFLDTRDIVITPIIALEGYWEPEIADFIRDTLRPGMTYVDVGANMGYFACIAAARVGRTGKVHAFEADPEVHAFLVDNLSLNWHFDNAFARNVAVWHETGEVTLHRRGKYKGNTSVGTSTPEELAKQGDTLEAINVPAAPLHELLPPGTRPDLIKIDVEGAEPWVLKGSEPLLSTCREATLVVEWSPSQVRGCGGDAGEIPALLSRLGYRMRLLEQDLRSIGADDLAGIHHGTIVADKART